LFHLFDLPSSRLKVRLSSLVFVLEFPGMDGEMLPKEKKDFAKEVAAGAGAEEPKRASSQQEEGQCLP
jgi:hypothetical protein